MKTITRRPSRKKKAPIYSAKVRRAAADYLTKGTVESMQAMIYAMDQDLIEQGFKIMRGTIAFKPA